MAVDLLFSGAYTPPAGGQVVLVFGVTASETYAGVFDARQPVEMVARGGAVRPGVLAGHEPQSLGATGGRLVAASGVLRTGLTWKLAGTGAAVRAGVLASAFPNALMGSGSAVRPGLLRGGQSCVADLSGQRFPRVPRGPAGRWVAPWSGARAVSETLSAPEAAPVARFARLDVPDQPGKPRAVRHTLPVREGEPRGNPFAAVWRGAPGQPAWAVAVRYQAHLAALDLGRTLVWGWSDPVSAANQGRFRTLAIAETRMILPFRIGQSRCFHGLAPYRQGQSVRRRFIVHWRAGHPPAPGRTRWPPIVVPPEPPGPPSGALELIFCEPLVAGRLTLIFRKVLCPQVAERTVPIRRVYLVWDSASLIRLSDGRPIPVTALSVGTNADSWVWQLSANLAAAADLALLQDPNGEPVEVRATLNGHEFDFLIDDDPEASEAVGGDGAPNDSGTLRGRSLGAYLDDPFAPLGTWTNTETRNARQLADDVLPYGTTLVWECEDWPVAPGAWSFRGTPARALLRIAEAAGGVLASDATGLGFRVAPRYPVLPWRWDEVSPWALIPRAYCAAKRVRGTSAAGYNAVFVVGERGGVIGRVLRAGTAGDRVAPQIIDPLATDPVMVRQRGGVVLAQAGRKEDVGLTLPVGAELGLIPLGKLLWVDDLDGPWRGLSRSVQVSAQVAGDGVASVMQSIQIERHLGDSARHGGAASRYNPWARFLDLTAGEPRLCGTVIAHHGDGSSSLELLGGGVLRVRGEEVPVGARVFVQGGKLDGAAEGVLVADGEV